MARTRHHGTWLLALVATALVLVLAGCGDDSKSDGTSDMKAVAKVMSDLNTASRSGDGERICSTLFTPKLAKSVSTSSTSGECATEVKDELFSPDAKISVESIDVPDEVNASAKVTEANGNTSTIFLVKQSGEWRIRSVAPA